jgi:hypothetical protein
MNIQVERLNRGLCRLCGKPRVTYNANYCYECREKQRARARKWAVKNYRQKRRKP